MVGHLVLNQGIVVRAHDLVPRFTRIKVMRWIETPKNEERYLGESHGVCSVVVAHLPVKEIDPVRFWSYTPSGFTLFMYSKNSLIFALGFRSVLSSSSNTGNVIGLL